MTLTHYTPPTGNDMQAMIQVSQMLAKSSLVPPAYRGKPENVLFAALAGQPFGWDLIMSMETFHIIDGKRSMKPETMLGLAREAGHSVKGDSTTDGATITGKRRDTGDEMSVTFTMEVAKRAGLAGKSVWKQYPQSMCWARALSQLCRMLFPDVVLGAGYTPEELGAETNDVTAPQPRASVEITEAQLVDYVSQRDAKKQLYNVFIEADFDEDEAKERAASIWSDFGFDELQTIESIEVEEFDAALSAARAYIEMIGAEEDEDQDPFEIEAEDATAEDEEF